MSLVTTPFGPRATAMEVIAGVDLTGRRAIVTGGASGLGAETVRALAAAGARVTIATRDPRMAKEILEEFPQVDALPIDLADLASVRAFCRAWEDPLDMLVANAGIMMLPTLERSDQGWEMQLATNYLGHFALAVGLRPALAAKGRSRVVVVSSGAQLRAGVDFADPQFESRPYDPFLAYAQSKTAGVLLAVGISRHWGDAGIAATSCAPGAIPYTNLGRHISPDVLKAMGVMDADGNLVIPDYAKTSEQGAATIVLLAASPLLEGVTGGYFEDNQEQPVVQGGPEPATGVAAWSADPGAADRLWDLALPVVESALR